MTLDFEMNALLAIGLIIIIGLLGGVTARKLKFPTISGYIIVGIIISLLNIILGSFCSGVLEFIALIKLLRPS